MNVKNLIGLEAQEKKFSKLSMIFLTCQKSWNFLRRMISGCYGSSSLEKLGKLRRGSQWGGGFYGYWLKFWLFYGYRLIFFSYG